MASTSLSSTLASTSDSQFHYSITTTHHISSNQQHCLTSAITTRVHTSSVTIRQDLLHKLPTLILNGINPVVKAPFAVNAAPTTSTSSFSSLITVGKSASGRPIKKLFTFDIQVDAVNDYELTFTTVPPAVPLCTSPSSPTDHDDPVLTPDTIPVESTPAVVYGTFTLTPQSSDTTLLTLTASTNVGDQEIDTFGDTIGAPLSTSLSSSGPGKRAAKLRRSSSIAPPPPATTTAAAILSHITHAARSLHSQYARYAAVDAASFSNFELVTLPNAAPITPHEDALVTRSLLFDDSTTRAFRRIKGTVREPVSYFEKIEGTAGAWGKAVATVDVSAVRLFAENWLLDSYEAARRYVEETGPDALRKVVLIPDSHSMLIVNLLRLPSPVSNRVFATWLTWRKEPDNTFILAWAPMEDYAEEAEDAMELFVAEQEAQQKKRSLEGDMTVSMIQDSLLQDAADLKRMIKERALKKQHVKQLLALIKHHPLASQAKRGKTRGITCIRPRAAATCEMTYLVQAELGGSIPTALLNSRIFSTLKFVEMLQIKFARNGKLVDKEMREVFAGPPPLAELSEESMSVVEGARSLESEDGSGWETLASPSPFVTMWVKRTQAKENERSVAIGKATAVIDCPVLEAAAWWFSFMSRERMRINGEEGNPARLLLKNSNPHDQVVATIKKMPFPLYKREFINRQVCALDANGDLLISVVPVDDVVDYGMSTRAVRGVARGIMRLTPSGESQCKVTSIQYLDAGGVIPLRVIEAKLPLSLAAVGELRDEFQRDDEIDKMERDELARVVKEEQQVYSEDEDSLIQRVQDELGALTEEDFEELDSPDYLVKMGKDAEEDGRMIVRASTTLDSSIEECAAWEMDKMSRKNAKGSTNLVRTLTYDNGHSAVFHFVKDFRILGYAPREFVLRLLWKKLAADKVIVCYESIDEQNEANNKYVRASNLVYNEYERLEPRGGVPQTRVTWSLRIELGGSISRQVVNAFAPKQLVNLSRMRRQFDKSREIDGATRAQNVGLIANDSTTYSTEENMLLAEGEKHFADFDSMKVKVLKGVSPLAPAKIAYNSGSRHAWGYSWTCVRETPEEILAWALDVKSRATIREDDLEKSLDARVNDHNTLVYVRKKTPPIIASRDFLSRCVWKKEGEWFVWVSSPTESLLRPIGGKVVRGKYPSAMRLKRKNNKETTVEYVFQIDFGGLLPAWLTNSYMSANAGYVTEIQEYFQELRRLVDYDAEDGRALGVRLMHPGGEKGKKPWRKVRAVVGRHKGLTELGIEYEWLVGFLEEVVRGKWVMAASVSTKLVCLSEMEARKIGRSLMPALKQRKTADAGLHQWKMQNRSMVELFEKYDWVESMLLEVAQEVMNTAPWGLMWRVCTSATLSVLDIVTDVVVIVGYMGKEETRGYGYSLMGMLVASMVLQAMIVFGQHRKKPREMAKEMLFVVTGMKGPVDAYRVCIGKQMEEHHVIDAKLELVMTKLCELVCESIPGCLLQVFVILKVGDTSGSAVPSLVVSALTAGFASGTVSYDYDTDPVGRKKQPEFYGYVPDEGIARPLLLVCMTLNSALLLLIRAFSAAMLMLVKKRFLVMYMAGDMALYLLQKVLRGDFHYWIPIDGPFGLLVSLLFRVFVKTIADFTGVVQFRADPELGGLYWTVNMFLALLASFGSVFVYYADTGEEEVKKAEIISIGQNSTAFEIEERVAWTLIGYLSGAWAVSFGVFLLLMKKEYRHTFFTTRKGKQWAMNFFLKGGNDEGKALVFTVNKKQWWAIREDVKEWVQESWWRWKEEKPEWFSLAWQSKVPKEWIDDAEERARLDKVREKGRRRSVVGRAASKGLFGRGRGRVYAGMPSEKEK